MPLFLPVAIAAVVAVVSIDRLLRRRAPVLSDKDLDATPGVPPNVRVVQRLSETEREALKEAFLKGSDFQWIAVGDDYIKTDFLAKNPAKKKQQEAQEKHKAITCYMVECIVRLVERYGHVLVVTENPRSNPQPGRILGSLALLPPYQSRTLLTLHFYRSVLPLGMPVTTGMGGGVQERFDAYADQANDAHHQVMHGVEHWYVANLGVSKHAQGKGVGKTLLNAATAMAGTKPLYLECHDDNVAFYKKMGYRHARQYEFQVKPDADNTSTLPYSYNCMVHDNTK